jgi:hypothetical protein
VVLRVLPVSQDRLVPQDLQVHLVQPDLLDPLVRLVSADLVVTLVHKVSKVSPDRLVQPVSQDLSVSVGRLATLAA